MMNPNDLRSLCSSSPKCVLLTYQLIVTTPIAFLCSLQCRLIVMCALRHSQLFKSCQCTRLRLTGPRAYGDTLCPSLTHARCALFTFTPERGSWTILDTGLEYVNSICRFEAPCMVKKELLSLMLRQRRLTCPCTVRAREVTLPPLLPFALKALLCQFYFPQKWNRVRTLSWGLAEIIEPGSGANLVCLIRRWGVGQSPRRRYAVWRTPHPLTGFVFAWNDSRFVRYVPIY